MSGENRLDAAFRSLRARNVGGLLPYITAGYPSLHLTGQFLHLFEQEGAAAAEIGFPYSDSIADGPVIQASHYAALVRGVRVADIFETVAAVRREVSLPLTAMASFSIVHRIGTRRFMAEAAQAGFDAVLMPDLALEEAPAVAEEVARAGLRLVMLVAPNSPPHRREAIARLCSGFVYYVSVTGITGERDRLPDDLAENIRQMRERSGRPVCVGFGVSRAEHVRTICRVADGAVVGSAIIRRISASLDSGVDEVSMLQSVAGLIRALQAGTRRDGCPGEPASQHDHGTDRHA